MVSRGLEAYGIGGLDVRARAEDFEQLLTAFGSLLRALEAKGCPVVLASVPPVECSADAFPMLGIAKSSTLSARAWGSWRDSPICLG